MIDSIRLPVEIEIHAYLRDHQFGDRVVLPAVESCQLLAANLKNHMPDVNPCNLYNASFNRFIDIKPEQTIITLFNEIEVYENGDIISRLLTKTKSKKAGITRTTEHVILKFKKEERRLQELPFDIASSLDGICFQITSQKIYSDLVLFGPAYHNISDILYLTQEGSIAKIIAAPHPARIEPLGSPFPFDAALHAACVWGQRYSGIAAFPVGFDKRFIINPTIPGDTYFSRTIPVKVNTESLIFDIWIYDQKGCLREVACGVKLKDVNAGMLTPPQWTKNGKNDSLKIIPQHCEAISVIELDVIAKFAGKAFSDDELNRSKSMREKRRKDFTGARLTCKRISRRLAGDDWVTSARTINTISDRVYPACPLPNGSASFKCSVSHDNRFAFAAASRKRIGVDVEKISNRILKSQRLIMNNKEKDLVHSSHMGLIEASIRVWSIKEAVTKALNIKFAESWSIAQVTTIGQNKSILLINGKQYTAYHDTIDDHLFTFIEIE